MLSGLKTIIAALRTALFTLVFYTGSVPFVVLAALAAPLSMSLLRSAAHGWGHFHYGCVRWLLGIRVVVDGHFRHGPVLYALRHESFFETIELLRLHERPVPIAKRQLSAIPLWSGVAKSYGMIYVDRSGGAGALRAMMKAAKTYIADGRPLVIFPEGTRMRHGERGKLQSGFAGLYRAFGLTVVPVAVDSGRLLGPYNRIKYPGTITYRVGDPIPPGLPRAEMEARVTEAINALNDCGANAEDAVPA
ncbi:MAG: lysophospholipid acyltransferase family protein [Pseudomonadota bacterium]